MNITETPVGLPSKLFRGTMPYEITTNPKILADLKANDIKQVVLLCPAWEYEFATCSDLKAVYETNNIKVIPFPIIDHQVPKMDDLRKQVEQLYADLSTSGQKNTLVHCLEGKGRTGLIIACLARKIFKNTPQEAIDWVRKYVPGAVEKPNQIKMIKDFIENPEAPAVSPLPAPVVIQPSKPISASQQLVELPLDLPSTLYKGVMPYEITTNPGIIANLKQHQIKQIVMLCTEEEYEFATYTDLKALYLQHQFQVVHFPIKDSHVPSMEALKTLVCDILKGLSKKDNNTLVHCMSGRGRTGLFAACLGRKLLGIGGDAAIEWVRLFIPKALDSENQRQMVKAIKF